MILVFPFGYQRVTFEPKVTQANCVQTNKQKKNKKDKKHFKIAIIKVTSMILVPNSTPIVWGQSAMTEKINRMINIL